MSAAPPQTHRTGVAEPTLLVFAVTPAPRMFARFTLMYFQVVVRRPG